MGDIKTIGIIGAGVMGSGIAQVFAQGRYAVILLDCSPEALQIAVDRLKNHIRLQYFFKDQQPIESMDVILARVHFTTNYNDLNKADFVIENAVEAWEIKQEVYKKIDQICPAKTVFGVNTSTHPIAQIAELTSRPSQVIGMHFMNPVPLKHTIEMIPSKYTSQDTVDISVKLLESIHKDVIQVQDNPGFVSNRLLMLLVNEAISLVAQGVAKAEDIDRIFTDCFEHKMGPLATADLIGLDTVLYSLASLYKNLKEEKFKPCPLLVQMVQNQQLGEKSGQGFYRYR